MLDESGVTARVKGLAVAFSACGRRLGVETVAMDAVGSGIIVRVFVGGALAAVLLGGAGAIVAGPAVPQFI